MAVIPHCWGFKSLCVQTVFYCSTKIVEGQTEPPVAINSVTREMNAQEKDGEEDTDHFFHPCTAPREQRD